MAAIFSMENEVFASLAFYSVLVVLKMFGVAWFTVLQRMKNKAFVNPEDIVFLADEKTKPVYNNEDVQRCIRNHINDMENIIPFILIGLLYITTGPAASVAIWHFRIFAVSRFLHTVAYQVPLPGPSRSLCFGVGFMTTVSMAVQVLKASM